MANSKTKVWVNCNVNDTIRFTPGPDGLVHLVNKYGRPYMEVCHPGWDLPGAKLTMPLWEFVRVFGPVTRVGTSRDYSTVIELEIDKDNVKEAYRNV